MEDIKARKTILDQTIKEAQTKIKELSDDKIKEFIIQQNDGLAEKIKSELIPDPSHSSKEDIQKYVSRLMTIKEESQYTADDWFISGLKALENKDYIAAIEYNTKVIKINSNYANAYGNRGVANSHLEEYEKAIANYANVIRINPRDA